MKSRKKNLTESQNIKKNKKKTKLVKEETEKNNEEGKKH